MYTTKRILSTPFVKISIDVNMSEFIGGVLLNKQLGNFLRQQCQHKGLSLRSLSIRSGLSPGRCTISSKENTADPIFAKSAGRLPWCQKGISVAASWSARGYGLRR